MYGGTARRYLQLQRNDTDRSILVSKSAGQPPDWLQLINLRPALRKKGVQYFLRSVERETVYPKDMWHGGTNYPRISRTGYGKGGMLELRSALNVGMGK